MPFEINPRKEKWLLASIHNAPSKKIKTNLSEFYSTRYEKVIVRHGK